jgi:hypothetical protein
MKAMWGRSPVGEVTRTEWYDGRGELYYVEWATTAPASIPAAGGVAPNGLPGRGRAPVGDVVRIEYYDHMGQLYYVEWRLCSPAWRASPVGLPPNLGSQPVKGIAPQSSAA